MNSIGEWIDINILIPMNNFAKKHPNMPLIISILALLLSILSPMLK